MPSDFVRQLLAEARYARERHELYKAKVYGPRPTSLARLRELERISEQAESRLRRAQRDEASATSLPAPDQSRC
jgi:hypothetical protein